MSNQVINKQHARIAELLRRIENAHKALEEMNHTALRTFCGQRYLTDLELSRQLKISRRTLQEYRAERIIPYYLISGKVIYKEADIQRFLEKARRPCRTEQVLV